MTLRLPLRLALLPFFLVLLEGAARPAIPLAVPAAAAVPATAALATLPVAAATLAAALPAAIAAASLSSLAHGRSFRWFSSAT